MIVFNESRTYARGYTIVTITFITFNNSNKGLGQVINEMLIFSTLNNIQNNDRIKIFNVSNRYIL